MKFPVRARTLRELAQMAEPQAVKGGQSEALSWIFYDTATYTSAATTELTFFTTTRANRQLSNLNGRGLPTPQYFEIFSFNLDVLTPAGTSTPIEDTWEILNGTGVAGQGGPTWTFILADKQVGPFPLTAIHGLGGLRGSFTTPTTGAAGAWAQNGDGSSSGYFADGAIVVPPNQTFSVVVTWPAALTLSADRDIRASMCGVLHRRVL